MLISIKASINFKNVVPLTVIPCEPLLWFTVELVGGVANFGLFGCISPWQLRQSVTKLLIWCVPPFEIGFLWCAWSSVSPFEPPEAPHLLHSYPSRLYTFRRLWSQSAGYLLIEKRSHKHYISVSVRNDIQNHICWTIVDGFEPQSLPSVAPCFKSASDHFDFTDASLRSPLQEI